MFKQDESEEEGSIDLVNPIPSKSNDNLEIERDQEGDDNDSDSNKNDPTEGLENTIVNDGDNPLIESNINEEEVEMVDGEDIKLEVMSPTVTEFAPVMKEDLGLTKSEINAYFYMIDEEYFKDKKMNKPTTAENNILDHFSLTSQMSKKKKTEKSILPLLPYIVDIKSKNFRPKKKFDENVWDSTKIKNIGLTALVLSKEPENDITITNLSEEEFSEAFTLGVGPVPKHKRNRKRKR